MSKTYTDKTLYTNGGTFFDDEGQKWRVNRVSGDWCPGYSEYSIYKINPSSNISEFCGYITDREKRRDIEKILELWIETRDSGSDDVMTAEEFLRDQKFPAAFVDDSTRKYSATFYDEYGQRWRVDRLPWGEYEISLLVQRGSMWDDRGRVRDAFSDKEACVSTECKLLRFKEIFQCWREQCLSNGCEKKLWPI